jgi:hypothetical protein
MLAIPESLLDASVYLYPSAAAGAEGRPFGGSGVVVGIPSALPNRVHTYVVTNRHVVDSGSRIVRFNTANGGIDFVHSEPGDWTVALNDDLAVLPFEVLPHFRWACIMVEMFIGEDCILGDHRLEVGDHAILMGRLVTHEGRQRNRPVGRFGDISMLADPNEPVRMGEFDQEAFLVECRSLSGFSGSPVLAYLADTRFRSTPNEPLRRISNKPKLLGIDCGHLPAWSPVCARRTRESRLENLWVETNSGIAVVIPAWRLLLLLNDEKLAAARAADDLEHAGGNMSV